MYGKEYIEWLELVPSHRAIDGFLRSIVAPVNGPGCDRGISEETGPDFSLWTKERIARFYRDQAILHASVSGQVH